MLAEMLRMTRRAVLRGLAAAVAIGVALPAGVPAEQASRPSSAAAGGLDVGRYHACAVLTTGGVRCWGYGFDGSLGFASRESIGDDELPAAAGPADLGAGRTAVGLSAGFTHTCAVLDDRSVRCWGFGADGQLGYGNTNSIGDDETPGSAGAVNLGVGRSATAVTAGRAHSCAVLDDGSVRCWGFGFDGRLGYGNTSAIGDNEVPAAVGPVKLGAGRTARAITAGDSHTCALLDDGAVRCWGYAGNGQLGYGNPTTFSDTQTPDTAGPVQFPTGRTAVAISAGSYHTCALLDDGTVRCWGFGGNGRLGYGATFSVGDNELPVSLAPVALGAGRTAVAISAGADHTCAVLDNGAVRCWGAGRNGLLGYANANDVGDDESPGSVGPVDLGPGRRAVAISAGSNSTCARLDDASVRCWGDGANGLLGICDTDVVGDDETPASSDPVALGDLGLPGPACATPAAPTRPGGGSSSPLDFGPSLPPPPAAAPLTVRDDGLAAQRARARALRDCRSSVSRRMRAQQRRVRSRPPRVRAIAIRQIISRAGTARRACLERFARQPGRMTSVTARVTSRHAITLAFNAAGSDGTKPPPARRYLIKQSLRPLRTARDVHRAPSLCRGACTFDVSELGAPITLNVTDLRRRRTYHYAVAARDNVSGVRGPYSEVVSANTG